MPRARNPMRHPWTPEQVVQVLDWLRNRRMRRGRVWICRFKTDIHTNAYRTWTVAIYDEAIWGHIGVAIHADMGEALRRALVRMELWPEVLWPESGPD